MPGNEPFYEFSMELWEGLEQDFSYNAMVSQRGVLNLCHSDAQRDAYTRRGSGKRLNGVDAELLDQAGVRATYPWLNFDTARFPIKGGLVFGGDIDGYNSYAQRGNLPVVGDVAEGGMSLMSNIGRVRLLRMWGDTLASALLANDVRLMGRSFNNHRPRGLIAAGSEEPSAIVELRTGARQEPNTRVTTAELFDGLVAQSQNRWPSLRFDAMAVNDLLSPFFAAGALS